MRERARHHAPVFERACSLAIMCMVLGAGRAHASDVAVTWDVPRAGCPDVEQLRQGLSRRLQREVTFGAPAPMTLDAHIQPEGEGYLLRLRTESPHGVEQRELRARTCNELARASVLIAALSFTQGGDLASVAPHTDDHAGRLQPYARAQLVLDLGTLPALGAGPSLTFGIALERAAFELSGVLSWPQDASVASRPEPVARLQLMAASAAGCYALLQRPALAACLHVEVGVLHARSFNVATPRGSELLWLLPSVGARVALPLLEWLRWSSELSVGLPWDRATFAIDELGPVHRVARVIGRLQTGLEAGF